MEAQKILVAVQMLQDYERRSDDLVAPAPFMKTPLIILLAPLLLLLTSCTDRYRSGYAEHERFHNDGSIRSPYYGRLYHYDPNSVHDAHYRFRGKHNSPYRTYRREN